MNWTKTELFRLTFAERIAESKVQTQQNSERKFSLSDRLSPNQKRHFTFWVKFGLSLKFGLSERLIQKVKSPTVYYTTNDGSDCDLPILVLSVTYHLWQWHKLAKNAYQRLLNHCL